MPTVVLVRHGVTATTGKRTGGRTPTPLDDVGRAQAQAVAARLSGSKLHAVYSSPIVRARETAEIVAAPHRLEVQDLDGVQELDHGRWTDRPLTQMTRTKRFERVVANPARTSPPDGEAFVAAQARAAAAVEEVVQAHSDRRTVVVVSHADIIKLVVAHYAGIPLDLFQRLVVSPGSLTVVSVPRQGMPRLVAVNDTGHLAAG